MDGIVFDLQRFSIHDGPGVRTTVFLKGCTLHCFWCHNPESIRPRPDLQFYPEHCIHCGRCAEVCPTGAHVVHANQHVLLRDRCDGCGRCATVCCSQALTMAGRRMSVEAVVGEALRDREFYRATGGGVTLSGGEPALQAEFSHAILAACRAEDVHTAVETAANCPWEDLALVLSATDLALVDVKLMDSRRHRQHVGAANERILANVRRMDALGIPIIARVPVVPTVNDSVDEIVAIAQFASGLANVRQLVLLPFHRLAEGKYRSLGLSYRAGGLPVPAREHLEALARAARESSVDVVVA
ncbi:MAG: glycyl-radical enzyme activating protein [Chloroflexi bacterium]|nr:glycyl-radical enzyme activating protein [Chloroflexota bacterium]